MNKSERHRVKRDELVTVFERVTLYVEDHLRQVGLIAAIVAACILGAFGLSSWLQDREQAASFLLGSLIQTYRAPVAFAQDESSPPAGGATYSTAEERDAKVVEMADQLLARYASSKSAPKALYYKALALSGQSKPEEAANVLDEFLRRYPDDFLAPMARYQFGRVRQAQGSPAEALIQFQALVEDSRGFFPREEALLEVGRCQEAMGKKGEALATYRKILSDFPNSEYEAEAKSRIAGLS
jgi:TolA-binding protein